MRIFTFPRIIVLIIVLIASQVAAQDRGLNNHSKNFTDPSDMRSSDWSDPREMQRAWAFARVRVPAGKGKSRKLSIAQLQNWAPEGGGTAPVIVYMHGCNGIWSGTHRRLKLLAENGFVAVAPASFARAKYPRSCDPLRHIGGLYRGSLAMRQFDAGYAVERVRALPFADQDRIGLMGLSQGAITSATFRPRNARQRVALRVVEGWSCQAGWPEYAGLNASAKEPVLVLYGADDPWFQNPATKGDCAGLINRSNGSKAVIYRQGALAGRHTLLEFAAPRQELLTFLKAHLMRP